MQFAIEYYSAVPICEPLGAVAHISDGSVCEQGRATPPIAIICETPISFRQKSIETKPIRRLKPILVTHIL